MTYNPLLTKAPYFNVSGLTSSQANYICELIKERLKPIQDQLAHFPTHRKSLDGEALDDHQRIDHIDEKLTNIGQWYAISAYLRSAIKEKEARLNQIQQEIQGLRAKLDDKLEDIDFTSLGKYQSTDIEDYLLTLPLEEVLAYKTAEAKASHIGKFIHNFDKVRQSLTTQERISLQEVGNQVFKIHHTPLYDLDELQNLQALLLAQHREYESTVNQYKAQYQHYQNDLQVRYQEAYVKATEERQNKLNELVAQETERLVAIKNEIANFKIVIPNEFKAQIDQLTNQP